MGHSQFDSPFLCSSADNSFTQTSAKTFIGARRGSKLLNHVQSRKSIILELSVCSVSQQHHSTPASHPAPVRWHRTLDGEELAVNMKPANICMQFFERKSVGPNSRILGVKPKQKQSPKQMLIWGQMESGLISSQRILWFKEI